MAYALHLSKAKVVEAQTLIKHFYARNFSSEPELRDSSDFLRCWARVDSVFIQRRTACHEVERRKLNLEIYERDHLLV